MKKLLSLLLVVLLLGSVSAFAENATLYTFSDPVLDVQAGEEQMHLELGGLCIAAAPVMVGEEQVIAVNVLGAGEPLMAAAFRVVGDRLVIDMDGWSSTYSASVPQMQTAVEEDGALALPGVDLDELASVLLSQMELTMEGDSVQFTLPYTAVNALAEQLLPAILESANLPEELDVSEVMNAIAELKATDSGVTISGSLTQSESGMAGSLVYFVVQNGETSEAPAVSISFELTDVFTLDVEAEGLRMHLGVEPETGLLSLVIDADGQGFSLSGHFGSTEGEIKVAELGDPASAIAIEELTDEQTETLGNESMMAAVAVLEYLAPMLEDLM